MKLKLYIGHTPKLGRRFSQLGQKECADLLRVLPKRIEQLVDTDGLSIFRGEDKLRDVEGIKNLLCDFSLEVDGFDTNTCGELSREIQVVRSRLEARREERGRRF